MPGKLSVDQKIKLIKRVNCGESVSSVCRDARIARKTFYQWQKRYREAPPTSKRQSSEPRYLSGKQHPFEKKHLLRKKIISIIVQKPEWGSQKIYARLLELGEKHSRQTINRLLKELNLDTQAKRLDFRAQYQTSSWLKKDSWPKAPPVNSE